MNATIDFDDSRFRRLKIEAEGDAPLWFGVLGDYAKKVGDHSREAIRASVRNARRHSSSDAS